MSNTKYKKFYELMSDRHKDLFDKFTPIHEGFSTDPDKWADQFHSIGRDVMDVVRDWERRLCSGSEKTGYGQYSASLAEKFQGEVKKRFPLIHQVGLIKK
jgi:hypothetical protein